MSNDIRSFSPSSEKDYSELGKEWDELADIRHEQLSSGKDVTYSNVVSPIIVELLDGERAHDVLDIGCGTGVLAKKIGKVGVLVTGIDISEKSIEIAKFSEGPNIRFYVCSLEEYADRVSQKHEAAVANMVLMNVQSLEKFLAAANAILTMNGALIYSMVHPCFWPRFCGYEKQPWYTYQGTIPIEGPFMISSEPDRVGRSTHVHRPISEYLNSFVNAGFVSEKIYEPLPNEKIAKMYPRGWDYPRYIVGILRKFKEIN